MTTTIWIYNVLSLFELFIVFGYGVFLIVYGIYRDFSVYKVSAKTLDILSKRTRELKSRKMQKRMNDDTQMMNDFRNLIVKNKLDIHLKNGAGLRRDLEMQKVEVSKKILQPNVNGMHRMSENDIYKK